ncbi:MAG: hypothetical protein Q4B72_02325 [Lachnospiraceae bacterium]|nr:hypothetical protein [Lachnospiraceae bacterium]
MRRETYRKLPDDERRRGLRNEYIPELCIESGNTVLGCNVSCTL